MGRLCCSVVLSGSVLLGARWGWAQSGSAGADSIASLGVGSFAMTVIAGLLLAFAFQALLTHLSIALGISALPDKAFETSSRDDKDLVEPPSVPVLPEEPSAPTTEESSEHTAESTAQGVTKDGAENAPDAHVPRQYEFQFVDQPHDRKKKRSLRLLLLTHAVGLWTVLTASLSLFFACLLAVKLSMVTSDSVGLVLGLVVWAGFFCLLFYLEVQSVASVAGSIWSLAIGGIRGSFKAAKGALSNNGAMGWEEKLATGARAIKEELLDEWDTDALDDKIETYIKEQLAAQLAKRPIQVSPQEVVATEDQHPEVNVENIDNRRQQFERDFELRVVNSKSSTAALFELGKSAIQGYQHYRQRQARIADDDARIIALPTHPEDETNAKETTAEKDAEADKACVEDTSDAAANEADAADAAEPQISDEDEARPIESEEYEAVIAVIEEQELIQDEVQAFIEERDTKELEALIVESEAEQAKDTPTSRRDPEKETHLEPDEVDAVDEGEASGEDAHGEASDDSLIEKGKEVVEDISEAVELVQEAAMEKVAALGDGEASALEQVKDGGKRVLKQVQRGGKQALKHAKRGGQKLTQEVVAQVKSLELPDVDFGQIKRDFIKIFKDPMASLQSLKRKLGRYDKERIIVLISSNEKIDREDVERIADKIVEARDEVVQKAEALEEAVSERLSALKQTALEQAEQASRATVSATWWLFATAVVAGICAALGGILAL